MTLFESRGEKIDNNTCAPTNINNFYVSDTFFRKKTYIWQNPPAFPEKTHCPKTILLRLSVLCFECLHVHICLYVSNKYTCKCVHIYVCVYMYPSINNINVYN